MKKFLAIAMLSFCAFSSARSQTINDVPLKDIDVEYMQLVGTSKLFSNKVNVDIDFGQLDKFFSGDKDTKLKDKDGKNITFNSMIDALNFMVKNGFEFVQAYVLTLSGQNVYHYLLRKKK